jgi:hypothetical protein
MPGEHQISPIQRSPKFTSLTSIVGGD